MVPSVGPGDKINSQLNVLMKILFATSNNAKLMGVGAGAGFLGVVFDGLRDCRSSQRDLPIPKVSEVGSTYYENARAKALAYAVWSGSPCIADDSGIEVNYLGGLPGVYTAGFGFTRLGDLLLADVSYQATFRCCMCFAEPHGRSISVEGVIEGALRFPRGVSAPLSSVPYSNFFTPRGEVETLAVLCARPGYASHRTKALTNLLAVLGFIDRANDQE